MAFSVEGARSAAERTIAFTDRNRRGLLEPAPGFAPARVVLADVDGQAAVAFWRHEAGDDAEAVLARTTTWRGVLGAFSGLADAGDEAFVRFAERYGVPLLCTPHGLPCGHDPLYDVEEHFCQFPERATVRGHELDAEIVFLAPWRRLVHQVVAVRAVADALHRDRPAPRAEWKHLWPLTWSGRRGKALPPRARWLQDADEQRALLSAVLDRLIEWSGLRPTFAWEGVAPVIELGSGQDETLAAVVRELLLEVAQAGRARFCRCGAALERGRSKWCRRCGKAAADRDAQRRRRARQRATALQP